MLHSKQTSNLGSLIGGLLLLLAGLPAVAQLPFTDPPDTIPQRGLSTIGQLTPSQIESINAINGNVTLRIPLGQLPPGPAGFSDAVNLVYNSSISDIKPLYSTGPYTYLYEPSTHGGGWNYGYKYTLWAQPRYPWDQLYAGCGPFPAAARQPWFKNFLMTPDGASHVLALVGVLDSTGTQQPPSFATDPNNDAYAQYDFAGQPNPFCSLGISAFSGTLIFATIDSTYIRVEANTVANTWVAYFPDGVQVTGTILTVTTPGTSSQNATDSDASQITDRNGNAVTISGGCSAGSACIESIFDAQVRNIEINYASSASGTWTDSVTSLGVNGNVLTSTVDWQTYTLPASVPYYCQVDASGNTLTSGNFTICDLTNGPGGAVFSPQVVTSVQLPPPQTGGNATTFNFAYNTSVAGNLTSGELHSVATCVTTGATCTAPQWSVSYDYLFDWPSGSTTPCALPSFRSAATPINPICRKVVSYQESRDGAAPVSLSDTTLYQVILAVNSFTYPPIGLTKITNPDGSLSAVATNSLCPSGFTSRDYCPPVVTAVDYPDGVGMAASIERTGWASNPPPPGVPASSIVNPYPKIALYSLRDATLQRATQTIEDANGNVTEVDDYDWGVTPNSFTNPSSLSCPSCLLRSSNITYYNSTPYWNHAAPQFLRAANTVTSGSGSTTFVYDSPFISGNVAQLQQLDSVQGMVTTNWTYLSNGNVSTKIDPNGVETIICYDSNNLYPVSSVVAAQTGATCPNPQPLPEGRTTTYAIDGNTGRIDSVTDADNSTVTSYSYDDLGRTTSATQGAGTMSRTTATMYDDVNLFVTTTQDDTPTQRMVTSTYYDPLGRVRLAIDGAGNRVQTAYRYGVLSSVELNSTPYLSPTDPTMGWTVTTRDPVGRVTGTQFFHGDGTAQALADAPAPWSATPLQVTGTESMTYDDLSSGCGVPANEVTDGAGNTHVYWSDGLGRMTAVTEPDGTITDYGYDILDNLSTVSAQRSSSNNCPAAGPTMRSFVYSNPLSRLQSASNIENGTVSYLYDNNGNPIQRVDANGTTTAAVANPATGQPYDGLNRPYGFSYTPAVGSANSINATPTVLYTYDTNFCNGNQVTPNLLKGVRVSVASSVSTSCYGYDPLGRLVASSQTAPGYATPFTFSYGYSLTDQLTSVTYPSGRVVGYSLDSADRVTAVQNTTGGGNYATINYTAPGGIHTLTMGNGVQEQFSWNDRMQPTQVQVTSPAQTSLLTLGFSPCPGGGQSCPAGNNGNLQSQTISFPAIGSAPALNLTQTYGYDALSRLTSATEAPGSWSQSYLYTNGNRYVSANSGFSLSPLTPTAASNFDAGNHLSLDNSAFDNNVATGSGNQTAIGGFAYAYDAENRMVGAYLNILSNPISSTGYLYDGAGDRVQKITCPAGTNPCTTSSAVATTTYVYDAFGNLAAEYGTDLNPPPCTICYVSADQIGSTRLVTDSTGNPVLRYDYLPFGEELPEGIGGRTVAMGYQATPDGFNPKFAGQVRDTETGLDYMNFRYYSSPEGLFLSADPANAGANSADPQTWNGYSYVGNNPLTYTDPDGLGFWSDLFGILEQFFSLGLGSDIGGVNSGPWNEQIPITGSTAGDPLNLGGVFGGGSTGPFIFSVEPGATISATPLPQGGPLDVILGPIKQNLADLIDLMSSGKPTPEAQWLIYHLQPNSVKQKNGVNAANLYFIFSGRAFTSFRALKRALGPAGEGMVWHHIVEQSKEAEFGAEAINNTVNAVKETADINQQLANYYSRVRPFTGGQTVRDWLKGQSWADQYNFGLKMRQLVENGQQLP